MKRIYLIVIAASVVAATPARAACFPPLGCTDSDFFRQTDLAKQTCDQLWKIRTTILKERGLCFEKEREIAAFGNAGCSVTFANTLLLNSAERDNLASIATVTKTKRCPR